MTGLALIVTAFTLRGFWWAFVPIATFNSARWAGLGYLAFSNGDTGAAAYWRYTGHAFERDSWQWTIADDAGWWCGLATALCVLLMRVSPCGTPRPSCALLLRSFVIFSIAYLLLTPVGSFFVKYDEIYLRPFSHKMLCEGGRFALWLRPATCIAFRFTLGLLLSVTIVLWPLRSSKRDWIRVRAFMLAPFQLVAVAGCSGWHELGFYLLQDSLFCVLKCVSVATMPTSRASPHRLLLIGAHRLLRRSGEPNLATANVWALFALLIELVATSGTLLACMCASAILLGVQGSDSPIVRYFLPHGALSLSWMLIMVGNEMVQDLAITHWLLRRAKHLAPAEKRLVLQLVHPPPTREGVGRMMLAQVAAGFAVVGFAKYPINALAYVRSDRAFNASALGSGC
jgi:hypothetical protein